MTPTPPIATRRRWDDDVERFLSDLIAEQKTAAEVNQALRARFRGTAHRIPALRTIERRVQRDAPTDDTSGAWTLDTSSVESDGVSVQTPVELVVPVLQAVIEHTEGRGHQLTNRQAARVATIRRSAPDLDPWYVFQLARLYVRAGTNESLLRRLDAFLTFAPWRSDEASARYEAAQETGRLSGRDAKNAIAWPLWILWQRLDVNRVLSSIDSDLRI